MCGEPLPPDALMQGSQATTPQSFARRAAAFVAAAANLAVGFARGALSRLVRPIANRLTSLYIRTLSAEEWRALVKTAGGSRAIDESGSAMLAGVFAFQHKRAHDVMRPRTEIVALPVRATERQVREVLRAERYSRYPVYNNSPDDVVGIFVAKDLWVGRSGIDPDGSAPFSLRDLMREPLYVPGNRRAERVLDDLRRTRAHMAVVLDEYGGTAGIVTMEDLVEQVIGEIADEYDLAARSSVELNGVLELAGSLSLIDVRTEHEVPIPEGEWTTLGGFAFAKLGRVPRIGDRVSFPGGQLEVIAIEGRRVAALRVHAAPPSPVPV